MMRPKRSAETPPEEDNSIKTLLERLEEVIPPSSPDHGSGPAVPMSPAGNPLDWRAYIAPADASQLPATIADRHLAVADSFEDEPERWYHRGAPLFWGGLIASLAISIPVIWLLSGPLASKLLPAADPTPKQATETAPPKLVQSADNQAVSPEPPKPAPLQKVAETKAPETKAEAQPPPVTVETAPPSPPKVEFKEPFPAAPPRPVAEAPKPAPPPVIEPPRLPTALPPPVLETPPPEVKPTTSAPQPVPPAPPVTQAQPPAPPPPTPAVIVPPPATAATVTPVPPPPAPATKPTPKPAPAVLPPAPRIELPPRNNVRAGERVPLAIRIEPRSALLDSQAIVITGLPPDFSMENASRNPQGAWVVAPAALPDAMIKVPDGAKGDVELTYELIGIEGKVVTSAKTMLVVAARPPQRRIDSDEVVLLIKRGREMFSQGDISGARLLLARASESNSAEAAFALAETYDPHVLLEKGIIGGITGDPAEARKWYTQALALGQKDAAARLEKLP